MNDEKKNHIPGIYNYCDRWCEKCAFTSRCLLFSDESKMATFEILNDRPPNAEELMEQLFDKGDDDNENDFNWDDYPDEEEGDFLFDQSEEEENDDGENELDFDVEKLPPLLVEELANQYLNQAHKLIKSIDGKFNFSSTAKESIALPQLKNIYENFEVISWYHTFIYVKTKRACRSKKEFLRYKDEDSKEFAKSDSDGTAKVAALSVNNSINALTRLHEYLPDHGNEIIMLSSLLRRIFSELEKEFPDYSKFKRPGFDD